MPEKPTYEELEKRVHELEKTELGHKETEKELRAVEQSMINVFESIQDGISVLNPDLSIRHANGVMKKWYPQNLPLEGKKCFECYQTVNEPCNPCPTLRCLESGKTETDIVPGLPDSDVEWIELFSYPIKDPNSDKTTGVVEFVRNITKRKQAEKALRESDIKHKALIKNIPGMVYRAQ